MEWMYRIAVNSYYYVKCTNNVSVVFTSWINYIRQARNKFNQIETPLTSKFQTNNWRRKIYWILFENSLVLDEINVNATQFSFPKYILKTNFELTWYACERQFRWVFIMMMRKAFYILVTFIGFRKEPVTINVKSIIQNVKSANHVYTCSILLRSQKYSRRSTHKIFKIKSYRTGSTDIILYKLLKVETYELTLVLIGWKWKRISCDIVPLPVTTLQANSSLRNEN